MSDSVLEVELVQLLVSFFSFFEVPTIYLFLGVKLILAPFSREVHGWSGPISGFSGYPVPLDIYSDVRTLSGGQGLGCPWGVVTPTEKNVSVPFQLVQKRA